MSQRRAAHIAAAAGLVSMLSAVALVVPADADPSPHLMAPARTSAAAPSTTAYRALTPCRLLDSRNAGAALQPDVAVLVPAAGRCRVPDDAAALVLTVTVTESAAEGLVTVWPSGAPRPATSIVNFAAGETRANSSIVSMGADGNLLLTPSAPAHVLVDVTGAFTPVERSTAGRFIPITPRRVLDTRDAGTRPAPGSSIRVPLPSGVPVDAEALSISIATADTLGAGYLTTFPTGAPVPASSSLNTDAAGQVRATGQIVAVDASGFSVFSPAGEHVIVDVNGWFTGPSAAASINGLFVPAPATRLVDTRGSVPLYPNGTIELDPVTVTGGPVAAIAANWTMTDSWAGGYVTAYPARTAQPATATANVDGRHQTVSQFGITSTSTAGIAAFSSSGSHLVADVVGWFVGPPQVPSRSSSGSNTAVADTERRVLLIGDSTLAGIRWYTNSQHALGGSSFVLDAESCRRLVGSSCYGRERRTPPNAVTAITQHEEMFDTVVVMTGYNDWSGNFSDAFDQVVAASRAKGAREILWLTYREGTAYRNPTGGTPQDQGFRRQNEILREKVASGTYPDVRILDYNAYTAPTTGWFTKDGVHFTLAGAYGTADYISRQIAFGHREPCPAPWVVGEAVEVPCSDPDVSPGYIDPMAVYAGNPNDVHCYEVGSDHHLNCRKDPKLTH